MRDSVAARGDLKLDWPKTDAERAARDDAVAKLLASDLNADSAVRVALLNSRELQATLEELGVTQADLFAAGLFHNPTLFASSRWPDRSPRGPDVEFSLTADVLDDFLIPIRKRFASSQVAAAESRVSQAVLELSAQVKVAFYSLQAREQFLERMKAIAEANDAAADLARRQYDAGNISRLDLANQQAISQGAQLELMRTKAQLQVDREEVNRLLQLSGGQTEWKTSGGLESPPVQEPDFRGLEAVAIGQRLDLVAAKAQMEIAESGYRLRQKTRFSPVSVGIDTERNPDGSRVTGPQVEIGLPIFDQGQADLARLGAEVRMTRDVFEALKAQVGSQVRAASNAVAASRSVAEYYAKTLLPERKLIRDETLLNYNAMQRSTYELLAAKEAEQVAERERIEAVRDYWIAMARLERAVGGRLPQPNPPVTN